MAHYAFLNENNIVTEVIPGKDEFEDNINWEEWYGNFRNQVCKRTSYNTLNGKHKLNETPFRKNFAGKGYFYDEARDAFIPPKLFESWILNEETCQWEAPTPYPTEGMWRWDEDNLSWIEVN